MAAVLLAATVTAQSSRADIPSSAPKKAIIDSFELIWSTLRDHYWDSSMAGLNWQAVHDRYLRKIEETASRDEARRLMSDMIALLPSSHLAIIPEWAYTSRSLDASSIQASAESADQLDNGSTGITVTVIDGAAVVEMVEQHSPAMKKGIRTGWKIECVDGKSVRDLFRALNMSRSDAKASLIADVVQYWLSGPVFTPRHSCHG